MHPPALAKASNQPWALNYSMFGFMMGFLKPSKCETVSCMDIWGPYGLFLKTFAYNVGHLIFSIFPFKVSLESKLEIFLQSPDSRGRDFSEKLLKLWDLL